jgi:hypothetical protein
MLGLLIAHALLDYALRTTALMAVFAFACGLLLQPLTAAESPHKDDTREADGQLSRVEARSKERRETGDRTLRPPTGPTPLSSPPPRETWPWPTDTPRSTPVSQPEPSSSPPPPGISQSGPERWGRDVAWPDAWRKPEPKKGPGESSDGSE